LAEQRCADSKEAHVSKALHEQTDRAAGVLLGLAAGDALGVPYEFGTPPAVGDLAEMLGGGLGDFAPGEWSDDTSMAVAIARVAATGVDLRSPDALDAIALGFLEWHAGEPPDIGIQTSTVLAATARRLRDEGGRPGETMTVESQAYARRGTPGWSLGRPCGPNRMAASPARLARTGRRGPGVAGDGDLTITSCSYLMC
jgi:hypothetical protein